MNQENNNTSAPKKNNLWIYLTAGLIVLAGINIYLYFSKSKVDQENVQLAEDKLVQDSTLQNLQAEYNASLVRLDELVGKNTALDSMLLAKNGEFQKIQKRIQEITSKNNITEKEYKEAKTLIESLQIKITHYEREIETLKNENRTLRILNDSLAITNASLNEKVELAKVLHVSNIRLNPIDVRRGGAKEKETSKARKVDLLRIQFDIDKNLIDEAGNKDLYIKVIDPKGELLSNPALGSGSFITAEGNTEFYSISKRVMLEKQEAMSGVTVDWNQSAEYEAGEYLVEIFHKGYVIGKQKVTLK